MRGRTWAALLAASLLSASPSQGVVRYDEGGRIIEGVQLLQDSEDDRAFYYLPQFPRLSTKPDGTMEFLCLKYVGQDGKPSGGLFHALIEFTLPPDLEEAVKEALQEEVPGAILRGPVPLMQAVEDGEEGIGGFRVVSATLSDTGEGGFTRTVITSGRAPLTPGSKAVVAAMLTQEGATLLWDSFHAPTSDVSVAITAYYEALVKGYNAKVSANMDVIYEHYSELQNEQKDFTKKEMRDISDELVTNGSIVVEVVDRTKSLDIDASELEGLLDLVTAKITELMFDSEEGWSQTPPKEVAVAAKQMAGRQEKGWLSKTFGGLSIGPLGVGVGNDASDMPYITDNQYVLKKRKDITRNSFSMNLSKATTIRVPVDTAGNLGGVYSAFGDDSRYFRVVNLADTTFEKRAVHFRVDGNYIDSFQDTINFVSVNFKKEYPDKPAVTKQLIFTNDDIKAGHTMKEVYYPRLGEADADWRKYSYQVRWSVRDRPTVAIPTDEDAWIETQDPAVSLVPPFRKRIIEIDADLELFKERNIITAVVEFATPLAGKPKVQRKATMRVDDSETSKVVSIYHDRGTEVGWRVTWHTRDGPARSEAYGLDSEYLYLVPPEPAGDGGGE